MLRTICTLACAGALSFSVPAASKKVELRAASGPSLSPLLSQTQAAVGADTTRLVQLFRILRAPPSLADTEISTAALIAAQLGAAGYRVERGSDQSEVVAVLRNGRGNTLLYRTDTGAAPGSAAENERPPSRGPEAPRRATTTASFDRRRAGHDVQVTWMLGMAKALVELRSEWTGTLVLWSQPTRLLRKGAVTLGGDAARRLGPVPDPDYVLAFRAAATPFGSLFSVQGKRQTGAGDVDVSFGSVGAYAGPTEARDAARLAVSLTTSFGAPENIQFAYFLVGVSVPALAARTRNLEAELSGDEDSVGSELDLRALPLGSKLATVGALQLLGKPAAGLPAAQ